MLIALDRPPGFQYTEYDTADNRPPLSGTGFDSGAEGQPTGTRQNASLALSETVDSESRQLASFGITGWLCAHRLVV
jgi:hypothetical protein